MVDKKKNDAKNQVIDFTCRYRMINYFWSQYPIIKTIRMKTFLISLSILLATGNSICQAQVNEKTGTTEKKSDNKTIVLGKWIKKGPSGTIGINFKEDGTAEVNFGDNKIVDVVTDYHLEGETITFKDKEGKACEGSGSYKVYEGSHYRSFDLINDDCGGRIKMISGFWTTTDYENYLEELSAEISETGEPTLYLNRARIYMATGNSPKAKADLDIYLAKNKNDARAYVNRAGTRFPGDLKGALSDSEQAIRLDPKNKNAFFLQGLALYGLDEKEKACESFNRAIELGFSILRTAEQQKCAEYWNK
jgi:hypothetical protein